MTRARATSFTMDDTSWLWLTKRFCHAKVSPEMEGSEQAAVCNDEGEDDEHEHNGEAEKAGADVGGKELG